MAERKLISPGLLRQLSVITQEERQLLEGVPLEREKYSENRRFVVDSDKLLETGTLISVRPHTRFVDFPAHSHNYVELIYMASGSTTHIINGDKTLRLDTGELLFLNQHVTHSIRRAEEEDIAVNFIVLPGFFDTAFDMIGPDNALGRFLAASLRQDAGEVSYLHFAVADILPVQNLVENMIWGIVQKQANNRRISQVTMGLLFLQLLNYTQLLEMPAPRQGGNRLLVVEALREVEENYRHASLSAVALRRNVSLAYVSRLVKEATGKSFKELLVEKRVAKSAQLLRQTQLSVQEIIAAVGYENTSFFHRAFRARYGQAPREYRAGQSPPG